MSNKKVLVVDDQEMIRKLIRMTFINTEFEIIEAKTGREAIEQAIKHMPELMILDIMMPGDMNGIKVCHQIRQMPSLQNTKIIILSAKTQQIDREEGFAAGADDYLVKPFSPEKLLKTLREYT